MTSILNNVAANTALLNLENTVQNLQNIQQQISTGLKISSAADNAAYFAISTVLKSDSSALSTVSDTLNLGGSSLGVATNALADIQTTLSDIKNQLLAATTPGVDRTKIQAQITQDQAQLEEHRRILRTSTGRTFYPRIQCAANTNYNASKSSSRRSHATPPATSRWNDRVSTLQTLPFLILTPAAQQAGGLTK